MPKTKIERFLLIVFILIFGVALFPSLMKRVQPAPKVIETVPATSSTNVSIETQQIKFVFNQTMKEEKSLRFQGMRVNGDLKWVDKDRTILVLELKEPLKPEAFYSISLLVKGRWGKPLDDYTLTFMTEPSETLQKQISAFNSGTLYDTDHDGLDDELEEQLGTLPTTSDTDADGLTDYEEYCKYRTDPTLADSDGDGISDADWNERREYTYSIRTVIDIKPPWDLEAMNDLFQDAQLIKTEASNYQRIEVIVYPYASPVLLPTPYPCQLPPEDLKKYVEPAYDLNYSPEMQMEIQKILSTSTNTLEVIAQFLHEIGQMKLTLPLDDPFLYTYKDQGELVIDWSFFEGMSKVVTESEVEEALAVNYFGDSMFKRKQYGACISRARLLASMLRAVGVPARVTLGIPLIYYYKATGAWERMVKNLNDERIVGSFAYDKPLSIRQVNIVAHSQVEAYLNNQWIRLGYQLNEGPIFAATDLVFIKIIDAADFSEVDFTKTWTPDQWFKEPPYRTVELSDQAAKYESKF